MVGILLLVLLLLMFGFVVFYLMRIYDAVYKNKLMCWQIDSKVHTIKKELDEHRMDVFKKGSQDGRVT